MKSKRTVIDIAQYQPQLDFAEAEHNPPFVFPEYQRELIMPRLSAGAIDVGIVAAIYLIFLAVTSYQMPEDFSLDKRVLGIYALGFSVFLAVYFFLFMLSCSQTPGMKLRNLIVVTRDDVLLDPNAACLRGFGYLIAMLPLMLGFVWVVLDPEHLTWTDKVSGTYVKKL
jgi:uncharacterized RDD family membrane protein YckC